MALVTRCSNPSCLTLFRVTPGQLQAFGGQVRCGSCNTVFDAFPSLTTVADSALKAPGAGSEPASAPVAAPASAPAPAIPQLVPPAVPPAAPAFAPAPAPTAPGARDSIAEERIAEGHVADDRSEPATSDSSPQQPSPAIESAHVPDEVPGPHPLPDEPDGERVSEWTPEGAPSPVDAREPPQPMTVERVPDLPGADSLDFVDDRPAPAVAPAVEATRTPPPAPDASPPDQQVDPVPQIAPELTDYSVATPVQPRRRTGGRAVRVAGIVIALLLALLLAMQAVHAYRTQIAAHYPASRPLLERLCRLVQCEVGLPKAADQLVIESSDLQAVDAAKPNLIQLAASVRNRASIEVAFPAIEVTLTDAQDRPLARRVLLPDQYLAGGKPAGAGLRAGQDFSVRLTLDTTELRPVGYRLYLFYP